MQVSRDRQLRAKILGWKPLSGLVTMTQLQLKTSRKSEATFWMYLIHDSKKRISNFTIQWEKQIPKNGILLRTCVTVSTLSWNWSALRSTKIRGRPCPGSCFTVDRREGTPNQRTEKSSTGACKEMTNYSGDRTLDVNLEDGAVLVEKILQNQKTKTKTSTQRQTP